MKLENQVTNLELSKKLKELGVKQDSLFKYCGGHTWYFDDPNGTFEDCDSGDILDQDEYCHSAELTCEFFISAFTVAELGEMLPKGYYSLLTKEDGWVCFPKTKGAYAPGVLVQATWAEAEANARAKMLIYLIENKLTHE